MRRRLWVVLVFLSLHPASAWAVDPAKHLTQFAHNAWRLQDGFLNNPPVAITQTSDGYIWIGTADGIMQFDGATFARWSPERGPQLPSSEVIRLRATHDGSVWIIGVGFLSRWNGRVLTNYETTSRAVGVVGEDHDGTVWLGESFPRSGTGSLCRVLASGLRCLGPDDGIPTFNASAMVTDRDGALWIGGDTLLLRWARGVPTVYRPSGLASNAGIEGIAGLAAAPDGSVWVGIAKAGSGLGLQRIIDGQWHSFDTAGFHGNSLVVGALYEDRGGTLWVGTADQGVYRISGDVVDHFDHTNGLSSDRVYNLFEDREGNFWVATAQGVDRFADTPVTTVSVTEGLCSAEVVSNLAGRDGSIWAGGDGGLTRLSGRTITCFRSGRELPGTQVTSLFEDHAGRLWVGLDQGLWVYENGRFERITRTDARPMGYVTGIAEDDHQRIWIAAAGPPRILMRVEGRVVREDVSNLPPTRRVAADPTGGLWVGLRNGDLAHVRDGQIEVHGFKHSEEASFEQLLPEADGSVLGATSYGLIEWRNGRTSTLSRENGLPCEQVYQAAFDRRGDLWLYMNCGLGILKRADLEAWQQNPATVVTIRTFGALDGARSNAAAFGSGQRSPDGRIWFANGGSLQVVDPEHLARNAIPPPVHIERVVADRRPYRIAGSLQLPPLTRDVEIDYVGLSFVAPQKVRFRYRLDGRDTAWQEPGNRRQAFYSDLRPGTYRFHVIASNNDGVWNEEGATFEISVAPTWYQTRAFQMLSIVAVLLTVWLAYRWRMRQMARALNARFDERLEERTQLARDLHDTLLQTLQGSKIVADTALDRPADAPTLARALQQVSAWIGKATEEGRETVIKLRKSTVEANDLVEAFHRAIEDCRRRGAIEASLTVTGDTKEMHPVVRDEIYRIGYEAIRNAYTHSRGSRIVVALDYGRDFTLRVTDDGLGVDSITAERGREGHFGLRGMRERATRIGATLSVNGDSGKGTTVVMTVPGRTVFLGARSSFVTRIRSLLRRTDQSGTLN